LVLGQNSSAHRAASRWALNSKEYLNMKILQHFPGKPQEPACPACSRGASGFITTDGDAVNPCELLIRDLSYWLRDATAYMKTCTTGPSSRHEQEPLRGG
jgi:hypothetical protein